MSGGPFSDRSTSAERSARLHRNDSAFEKLLAKIEPVESVGRDRHAMFGIKANVCIGLWQRMLREFAKTLRRGE